MSLLNYEKNVDRKFASDVLATYCKLYDNSKVQKDILEKTIEKIIQELSEEDKEFAKMLKEVILKKYPDSKINVNLD